MADETTKAGGAATPPVASEPTDTASKLESPDKAKKEDDLIPFAQTGENAKILAGLRSDVVVPKDLSKVSVAKAKELAEAGLVEDSDLPGKMYKRKADGFVTRIPDYTFNAYVDYHKDEWEEIKLPSADGQSE